MKVNTENFSVTPILQWQFKKFCICLKQIPWSDSGRNKLPKYFNIDFNRSIKLKIIKTIFAKVIILGGILIYCFNYRYHIILDCAKVGYQNIPSSWKYDTFITLNSPLLVNTDNYGLIPGLAQSANDLITANLSRFQDGSCVKWGFFVPSNSGFKFIDDLVLRGKVGVY